MKWNKLPILLVVFILSSAFAWADDSYVLKVDKYVLDTFGKDYVGQVEYYGFEYSPPADTYTMTHWNFVLARPSDAQFSAVQNWQLMTNQLADIVFGDDGQWRLITDAERQAAEMPEEYTRAINATRKAKKSNSEITDIWESTDTYKTIVRRNTAVSGMVAALIEVGEDLTDDDEVSFDFEWARAVMLDSGSTASALTFIFHTVEYIGASGKLPTVAKKDDSAPYLTGSE